MKNMLLVFYFLSIFCVQQTAKANESGVIVNGKKIVLYRDGEKDQNFEKSIKSLEVSQSRNPSSTGKFMEFGENRVYYQTVDGITCFSLFFSNWQDAKSLSCVRAASK